MVLHAPQLTPADWPAAYAAALPSFVLLRRELPSGLLRLSDLSDAAACGLAVAEELRVYDDLDSKSCGAFFLNRMGYEVARAMAALDLTGHQIGHLTAESIAFRTSRAVFRSGDEDLPYLQTSLVFPHCFNIGNSDPAARVNDAIVRVFAPVIEAVTLNCKLSKGALWRIVADGVAAAYLELGKAANDPEAKKRAEAILCLRGSPLWNKQVGFIRVDLPASEAPDGQAQSETFRKRGGCCRYYKSAKSGGKYCATCIHEPEPQVALMDYLKRRRLAEMHA